MNRPDNRSLKASLTRRFPITTWSVSSGRGTASSWTHIRWTDGPTEPLVTQFLTMIQAAPGSMDQTDYFNGERIGLTRHISETMQDQVARALLGAKVVPPRDAWDHDVQRPNSGGWYNFHQCVWSAASNRENFERAQFDAHAWLEAWAHNRREAPNSVNYEALA